MFADQLTYIVNHAEDEILFVDSSLCPLLWPLLPAFEWVRHVVVMDDVLYSEPIAIPEPTSIAIAAAGLIAAVLVSRRTR